VRGAGVLDFEPLTNSPLNRISPRLIEQYRSHCDGKVGLVTMQHSLRALRRALTIATEVFEYSFKPPRIKLRPEPRREYVLSEADFQRFLPHCGEHDRVIRTIREGSGPMLQGLYTVLYDLGLRAGEATRLMWENINLDKRSVFIASGKTKAARRRIGLTARCVDALTALQADARDLPSVFRVGDTRKAISVVQASAEFRRIRNKLGLPTGCVLHSLRHSAATRMANKGASVADMMAWFGWSTAQTAMRYIHLAQSRIDELTGLMEK
jgi:integrase